MKKTTIKVEGLREVDKFMKESLPDAMARRKVTLQALRESAKPMVDGAKSRADRGRSGSLSESIGIKTISNSRTMAAAQASGRNTYAAVAVAPMSGNHKAWARYLNYYRRGINLSEVGRLRHAHLVEFGFRHTSGKHVPARPFLRPAFDDHANDVTRFIKGTLKAKTIRAARKAGVKVR